MDMLKFCAKCRKENEETFHVYIGLIDEDCYECTICQNNMIDTILTIDEYNIVDNISDDISFLEAMIKLKQDDIIEFQLRINQFKLQQEQAENIKSHKSEEQMERLSCPKCGSTSITEGTKGFSIMTGFIGSDKFRYVCKDCGNKWKPGSMLEILQRANNRH